MVTSAAGSARSVSSFQRALRTPHALVMQTEARSGSSVIGCTSAASFVRTGLHRERGLRSASSIRAHHRFMRPSTYRYSQLGGLLDTRALKHGSHATPPQMSTQNSRLHQMHTTKRPS